MQLSYRVRPCYLALQLREVSIRTAWKSVIRSFMAYYLWGVLLVGILIYILTELIGVLATLLPVFVSVVFVLRLLPIVQLPLMAVLR